MPTRDQVFLNSFGSPPPTISISDSNVNLGLVGSPYPDVAASLSPVNNPYQIGISVELQKAYTPPTDQGRRGSIASRRTMMYDPRNSPSRSQKVENYTDPIQVFAASNVWQTPSGRNSKGERLRQPSTKTASPFTNLPIRTRMPWDL